jgi:hypothetical protein
MPDPVTILRVDEALRFDELGKEQPMMRVQFKVGVHGPFYKNFPKEGFSGFAAKAELEQYARELANLQGTP